LCAELDVSNHSQNVALTWSHIIATWNLNSNATVVEVAPGHSPKVGLGLFLAIPEFKG